MKQYILSNASDNMSLFGRIDIAFFHFIWMSTFLRISSFISNGMGFEGNLVILIAISFILLLMLFWILPLNLLAYFVTRHQECLMSILIYVGWLASHFLEYGLCGMQSKWHNSKWLLLLLFIRGIMLVFMIYNNKSKYIFEVKIIICILLLYFCVTYLHVFSFFCDVCISIVYVSYALCSKNGWSRCCDNIIYLYIFAMLLLPMVPSRILGLFQKL
jgi:hypothetical protein